MTARMLATFLLGVGWMLWRWRDPASRAPIAPVVKASSANGNRVPRCHPAALLPARPRLPYLPPLSRGDWQTMPQPLPPLTLIIHADAQ